MSKLFREQYRIASVRLKGYDYSWPGYYMVTICAKGFRKDFGIIMDGSVVLSETGEVVTMTWNLIPERFPAIDLDEFILMPDHLHGIIRIKKQGDRSAGVSCCQEATRHGFQSPRHNVRTDHQKGGSTGIYNPMLTDHSLGKVIRWFKGASSYYIHHKVDRSFGWHPRYYDCIIQGMNDLLKARDYIRENPKRWVRDNI
ncbi:MAG: hypothetical protein D4R67_00590 [Bacteroidetes bacterium]|nr:MAG: hypothetical protein D4R67_00590 [Bacteroidota bacterium]